MQQEASTKLGFSPKKTMQIAQTMYEGIDINGSLSGIITYMRTDSVYISQDFVEQIRDFINQKYGDILTDNHLEPHFFSKMFTSTLRTLKNRHS